MRSDTFVLASELAATPDELWSWHVRPGAFMRLAPPWQAIRLLDAGDGVADGSRAVLELRKLGLPLRWVAEHRDVTAPAGFDDVQVAGPFRAWEHRHRFLPASAGSVLRDEIHYALPLGAIGHAVAGGGIRRDLERTFRFRHDRTRDDLALHRSWVDRPPLRVAVSGSSGLIGSELCALLTTGGHDVLRLVRREAAAADEAVWDPEHGVTDLERLEGIDAVVHLAAENIAEGRWTKARKAVLRHSRLAGTSSLARSVGGLAKPPRVFVSASGVGVYGDRGDEPLDESSTTGQGFLPELATEWEEAAHQAGGPQSRVVLARFGVVITPRGGALGRMLVPFLSGLGGRLGPGDQQLSWISIDDAVRALLHLLMEGAPDGPVNVTAPEPITNRVFTQVLGRVVGRPTLLPVPAILLRAAFGEMAEETLLASTRAEPAKLLASGFRFLHPSLESALRHVLGRVA